MRLLCLLLCLLGLLTQLCRAQTSLPHVESIYEPRVSTIQKWDGQTLAQIVPAATVKQIIFVEGTMFRDRPYTSATADYDALLSHLYASTQRTHETAIRENERVFGHIVILTTEGKGFYLDFVTQGGDNPSAVLVQSQGGNARIEIEGFSIPELPTAR